MKKWHGLSIPIIIISFIVGLILFFGGQYAYSKYNIETPLEELIKEKEYVQNFTVERQADKFNISVQLNIQQTDLNFSEMYQDLNREIAELLGNRPYSIEIKDKPDQQIKNVWRQSQYLIEEAIMRGNFSEMAEQIQIIAGQNSIHAEVYVDRSHVYVLLKKNDGHNMLKVITRQNFMVTGKVADNGGVAGVERN